MTWESYTSLSLSLTHTHSHTRTLTHTYTHTHIHTHTHTVHNRGAKSTSSSSVDEKKPLFLEPGSLEIYHTVAGKLHHLSRLPPKTDIHEWLATNCESKLVEVFCDASLTGH